MMKGTGYEWRKKKMSVFEKKRKQDLSDSEQAWQGCGHKVGVKVWRIVEFKVEDWPAEQYGEFFNRDTYIILKTYKEEEEIKYDIHIWIGKFSTLDDYSTAAKKMNDLDTFLDDKPIQHREIQGHESSLFKSYFKPMKLLKGDARSGDRGRNLPDDFKPRLLHVVKGPFNENELKEISMKKGNLKSEGVFIIDNGTFIYQWNGSKSSPEEKYKAARFINDMQDGKKMVESIEEDSCSPQHPVMMLLKEGESKAKSDAVGERKMFEISEKDGDVSMKEIAADDDISKELLKRENVYIINTGDHVWCWVGSKASPREYKNGVVYAHNYIDETKTPLLPVTVVAERKESKEFKNAF